MKKHISILTNEQGSVLVFSMIILVLLTFLGISAIQTTNIEMSISGNEKWYTMAFYGADGGSEAMVELLEQNIFQAGFEDSGNGAFLEGIMSGDPNIPSSLNFYMNSYTPPGPPLLPGDLNPVSMPNDNNRDAVMPVNALATPSLPHTNFTTGGNPELSTGSAIQMAAGYEGKGKGVAGAGGHITYEVVSQRTDLGDSEATVRLQWQHVF